MNVKFKRFAEEHGFKAAFHGSKGNTKCTFGNFGFPAVYTCYGAVHGDCDCLKACYAMLQENQYPDKLKADWENLLLYLEDRDVFKEKVIQFVIDNDLDTLRGLESGDAPNKEFFFMMKEIHDELLEKHGRYVPVYAYTKQWILWDFINEIPVWSWKGVKLMMSGWGAFKVPDELRKYYRVFKAVTIFEIDDVEENGYAACNGNCGTCRICADKDKDVDVYTVIHGSAAVFKIPEQYKGTEKLDVNSQGFIKFGGKTVGGLRDAYCKGNGITGYENRIAALKKVWRMLKAGEIVLGKNGFIVKKKSAKAA